MGNTPPAPTLMVFNKGELFFFSHSIENKYSMGKIETEIH